MPKGTRVHRCVDKVKKSGKGVNPYAVCQASTDQSYATGKKLKEGKNNMKNKEDITREITTQRVRAGSPSKPVSDKEISDKRKRQRPIKTAKKITKQRAFKGVNEGEVKARNKAKKREWEKTKGRKDTGDPSYRAIISTRKAARHGQGTGAASVVAGRERQDNHTEYKRLGLYLAEAMGFRIDEAAFLAPIAAGAARLAAVAGRGVVVGAKAAGKAGAQGAKAAGKKAGAQGAKAVGKMARKKAIDMAKEKLAQRAQGGTRRVQAGPEGVATGDDEAQKSAELKAQAASDDDLEEGLATGHSPTQTGRRVGRFVGGLERNPATTPEHLAKKKVQANRIANRTSARQGKLVTAIHKKAGATRQQAYSQGVDADAQSKERFSKNYYAGKDDDLGEGKIMNKYVEKLYEYAKTHEAAMDKKGSSDTTGFAYPIARKYGKARSSKGIRDPGVKGEAKEAKARMEKKLKLKRGSTKPQAQHMVQAALNRQRPRTLPQLSKRTQAALDSDDRKKRAGPDG